MTEKQLQDDTAPILIDFDLKYNSEIRTRQHTEEDIQYIISVYFDKIKELLILDDSTKIPVYVFEKPNVNIRSNQETKDGIHIIIGIQMNHKLQLVLRENVIKSIEEWVNLPITNNWENIIDLSISRGSTPWQLYGSRKPDNEAYELVYHYLIMFEPSDESIAFQEQSVENFINSPEKLKLLSARNSNNIAFPYTELSKKTLDDIKNKKNTLSLKSIKKYSYSNNHPNLSIRNQKDLDEELENFFCEDNLRSTDYHLKEVHQMTMILPDNYSNDYDTWIKTGWALKNTDNRLFLTWIKFSSKSSKFKFSDISSLYDKWQLFEEGEDCLTSRSITYWAKNYWDKKEKDEDVENEYNKIVRTTVNYYVEKTIKFQQTDFDFAQVLKQMFGNQFVCISYKNDIWYEFIKHSWKKMDSGITLKYLISTDMHDIYQDKILSSTCQFNAYDQEDDIWNDTEKRVSIMSQICIKLKDNTKKEKIMKEGRILFYDNNFAEKMDANPYLLGFLNGIVDFKEKRFRPGYPDDYVTKSTKINYIPLEEIKECPQKSKYIDQIHTFMSQLFPDESLKKYMWNLLASCLIGINYNQTFSIFIGAGSNGKSLLMKIMKNILGEYYELLPLSYITQKRQSIGNTSSEIAKLIGVRLTGTNESSKNDRFNEGVIKELTGGDPIQARALFKDSITFTPQCKVILCTNNLPEITATDDGTWRRIRKTPFESKFVDKPVDNDPLYPYQFKKDMTLETRIEEWNETFMAMLVEIAFETNGIVEDCDKVIASSNEYRSGQDYIVKFMNEKIEKCENESIEKGEITEEYTQWFKINLGRRPPKMSELFDIMNQKYGNFDTYKCWKNVRIIY